MEKNEKLAKVQQARRTRMVLLVVVSVVVLSIYSLVQSSSSTTATMPQSVILQKKQHPVDSEIKGPDTSSTTRGAASTTSHQLPSEESLEAKVVELDKKVRAIKATGVFMEVDAEGLAASKRLQDATRLLLAKRYGPNEPYRVRVELTFQESNPTFSMGEHDSFMIELAPSSLVPHSIFSFLEIARHWPEKKGAFHRRANHVLQVMTKDRQSVQHLAFQEYSPEFPHKKGTVGYAGRPCT